VIQVTQSPFVAVQKGFVGFDLPFDTDQRGLIGFHSPFDAIASPKINGEAI
jgi:hypothetical protein